MLRRDPMEQFNFFVDLSRAEMRNPGIFRHEAYCVCKGVCLFFVGAVNSIEEAVKFRRALHFILRHERCNGSCLRHGPGRSNRSLVRVGQEENPRQIALWSPRVFLTKAKHQQIVLQQCGVLPGESSVFNKPLPILFSFQEKRLSHLFDLMAMMHPLDASLQRKRNEQSGRDGAQVHKEIAQPVDWLMGRGNGQHLWHLSRTIVTQTRTPSICDKASYLACEQSYPRRAGRVCRDRQILSRATVMRRITSN